MKCYKVSETWKMKIEELNAARDYLESLFGGGQRTVAAAMSSVVIKKTNAILFESRITCGAAALVS